MSGTGAPSDGPLVHWPDERHLHVGDLAFRLHGTMSRPARGELNLLKWPELVQQYLALRPELSGGRVLELGIFEGGSTAFLAELYRPTSLVAVDLEPDPPPRLVEYLATSDRADAVHCHHGVDQADRATLWRLVDEELGGTADCVIDDASHLLGPTMASFEALFPVVRPGGLYIIEDWSAALALRETVRRAIAAAGADGEGEVRVAVARQMAEDPQLLASSYADDPDAVRQDLARPEVADVLRSAFPEATAAVLAGARVEQVADLLGVAVRRPGDPPARDPAEAGNLTHLVAHLVHAALTSPEVIASIRVDLGVVLLRRGPAALDRGTFDLLSLAPSALAWPS